MEKVRNKLDLGLPSLAAPFYNIEREDGGEGAYDFKTKRKS